MKHKTQSISITTYTNFLHTWKGSRATHVAKKTTYKSSVEVQNSDVQLDCYWRIACDR